MHHLRHWMHHPRESTPSASCFRRRASRTASSSASLGSRVNHSKARRLARLAAIQIHWRLYQGCGRFKCSVADGDQRPPDSRACTSKASRPTACRATERCDSRKYRPNRHRASCCPSSECNMSAPAGRTCHGPLPGVPTKSAALRQLARAAIVATAGGTPNSPTNREYVEPEHRSHCHHDACWHIPKILAG